MAEFDDLIERRLQQTRRVAIVPHVRPPPPDSAKRAFLRVIVCGRIVRLTVLLSMSGRPA
jgi:hypothetical protein